LGLPALFENATTPHISYGNIARYNEELQLLRM
jgi:hypothetical protein